MAESFYMKFRGGEIEVVINHSCGAKPDVGLMRPYVDDWSARDVETGAPVKHLTEPEEDEIQEAADEYVWRNNDSNDDYGL